MFGISLNPLHYVLGGVCLLLVIVSGLYWWQGTQLELTKARYDAFVAETKAVGVIQDTKGRLENTLYNKLKEETDHEIDLARNSIASYADELRSARKNSSVRLQPAAPLIADNTFGTCYTGAELASALGSFESETRGAINEFQNETARIAEEGAEAVAIIDALRVREQDIRRIDQEN